MHPRNRYLITPPNYPFLIKKYPSLQSFTTTSSQQPSYRLDWSLPGCVEEVTRILLLEDFNIAWNGVPKGHLVPPIPRCLNYIHWIEDLLNEKDQLTATTTTTSTTTNSNNNNPITSKRLRPIQSTSTTTTTIGIDVGTGASAIFPLLSCAMHPIDWFFIGLDCDIDAIQHAKQNIPVQFQSNIHLIQVPAGEPSIVPAMEYLIQNNKIPSANLLEHNHNSNNNNNNKIFVMCNPPFFDEPEQNLDTATTRPFSGSQTQRVYKKGGEVGFIQSLIQDSKKFKTTILWFTCMFGQKQSLRIIYPQLEQDEEIQGIRTFELIQGNITRWGLAWTFDPELICSPNETPRDEFKVTNLTENEILFDRIQHAVNDVRFNIGDGEDIVKTCSATSNNNNTTTAIASFHSTTTTTTDETKNNWSLQVNIQHYSEQTTTIMIKITTYNLQGKHSLKHAQHICNSLKADIQRINRRWRRKANTNVHTETT
jgi:23S rRNA A1618 N6-methylase RlmF